MLLERLYDEMLAQASYLVGCEDAGTAVVIDPTQDVDRYIDAARRAKMRIAFVTETHLHADFVSGARDLAKATGATLLLSAAGDANWQYRYAEQDAAGLIRDGDSFAVGAVRIA